MQLTRPQLEELRDRLRVRGQRPSVVLAVPATAQDLIEALELVETWGAFVEAMYLVMVVDRRLLNVEREVLRGALAIISGERVRTRHMEAMLDAAARNVAKHGFEARVQHVVATLRKDRVRSEVAVIVASAIAAVDARVGPEEQALLDRYIAELGVTDASVQEAADALLSDRPPPPSS